MKDRSLSDVLTQQLEASGISVVRFNPDKPWDDPVERMAQLISTDVGCLVSLRLGRPLSKYCKLEEKWAEAEGLQIIYADKPDEFPRVITEVHRTPTTKRPSETPHERWHRTVEFFRDADEELSDNGSEGSPDEGPIDRRVNREFSSKVAADLNWAAKADQLGALVGWGIVLLIYAVLLCGAAVVFTLTAAFFSKYFLLATALCLLGAAYLAYRSRQLFTEFNGAAAAHRRRGS